LEEFIYLPQGLPNEKDCLPWTLQANKAQQLIQIIRNLQDFQKKLKQSSPWPVSN
jgi:hypothetical protein